MVLGSNPSAATKIGTSRWFWVQIPMRLPHSASRNPGRFLIVIMEEICKCGEKAIWMYMPMSTGNPYYCDSCVPRGCSCNSESFYHEAYFGDNHTGSDILEHMIENKIKFRIADNMINGEEAPYLSHKRVIYLDEQGRELPCCEYMHLEFDAKLINKIYG